MDKILKDRIGDKTELIDILFNKIEEYDRIAVFRHEKPDYDALGSQMGLVTFIKDNWPNKEVIYIGDEMAGLPDCFPKMMDVENSWFDQKYLGIVLDLSNMERISADAAIKADYLIKIDHHPLVEHFGNIEIVDPTMVAVGEFLGSILLSKSDKYKISPEAASYLFKALVGDSGRFLYTDTTVHTFYVAQKLLESGFDLNKAYHEMYDKDKKSLEVRTYILKHYKITKNGVAYYVLKDRILKRYNLKPSQGKDNINIFSNFKGINVWCSISEDRFKGNWRVSIRSGKEAIDGIAAKFGGGGHAQASATKVKTFKEAMELIETLDSMFASK